LKSFMSIVGGSNQENEMGLQCRAT
jgi:hypothetical protein